jgi:hypothetical protein
LPRDKVKDQKVNDSSQKGKVTVVMFQLEGSDDTLRDAIKVLGQGIEKLASGAPVYRLVPTGNGTAKSIAAPANKANEIIDAEYADAEEKPEEDDHDEPDKVEDIPPGPSKKRRVMRAVAPLKDVDWETGTSFRDYAAQKHPTNSYEKYLVIAGWFKNFRSEDAITSGHIVAAFDLMDWDKPEDIAQVFRAIKHKHEWMDRGDGNGKWVLGQRGINQLDRMDRNAEPEA